MVARATKPPLADEIARVLRETVTADAAETVLALARAEAVSIAREAADAEADALSPLLAADKAATARAAMADAEFRAKRNRTAVAALTDRVAHLRHAEVEAVANAEREAAVAERDELSAAIREKVPSMIRSWTGLVRRIAESDARLAAAGVSQGAESIAREYPAHGQWPNGAGPVMRLRDARIPLFGINGVAWGDTPSGPVWPGEA